MKKISMGKTSPSPALERCLVGAHVRHIRAAARRRVAPVFCARCGGPLAWRNVAAERCRRRVCRNCGAIAYENPKIVAGVLPELDGRIFLSRRAIEPARGAWTFPAGFMELGESVEQAARRETREEICCRVRLTGLQGIYSHPHGGGVTVVYRGRVVGAKPRAGHETLSVRAFRPSEIPWEKLAFLSVHEALRDWVASRATEPL
jgi:ADP-ribose pyrophosphatase YjhB (NUDIX family)